MSVISPTQLQKTEGGQEPDQQLSVDMDELPPTQPNLPPILVHLDFLLQYRPQTSPGFCIEQNPEIGPGFVHA